MVSDKIIKAAREEYKLKKTQEITEKLNLDMEKIYTVTEINDLLDKHNMRGGAIVFKPQADHTAEKIILTLVTMDMIVSDAIHNNMGYYADVSKCEICEQYEKETDVYCVNVDGCYKTLCSACRREKGLNIGFSDFMNLNELDRQEFIEQEKKYNLDYTSHLEYAEKTNKRRLINSYQEINDGI